MTKYFKTLYFILFWTLLSSCTSMTMFEDDAFFFKHETVKQNRPINHQNKPQPEQQSQIKPSEKSHSIENKPDPIESSQNKKPLSIKPQPVETNLNPEDILSSYQLDAGDLISIKVFDEVDFSVTTPLNESGTISYPFLGELKLANLTVTQAEQLIIKGLQDGYLINPKVTITILEYRKVFVNGEVKKPGGYTFAPGLTVEKAISLAGGFTEIASPNDISIVKNDNQATTPELVSMKTFVRPGNIIIIKEYPKFFVNGEVNKPGAYAFEPGLTVEKVISMAGGFTEFASSWSKIILVRDGSDEAISVNLKTPIKPGDIITIKEGLF